MSSGIRPGVWLASATALAGVAFALLRFGGLDTPGPPREEPPRVAHASPERVGSPVKEGAPAPLAARAAPRGSAPAPRAPLLAAGDPTSERPLAANSRIAAELRIMEEEAARAAEARALLDVAALDAELAQMPDAAARSDRRRVALADALLIEHLVQDAYRGTEFPIGYPAEERTRAAARSQVGGLGADQRRDLLEVVVALQDELPPPAGPRFAPPESGLVWEGAAR